MHVNLRSKSCQCPAASRVVEVDVGEEQMFDLLERGAVAFEFGGQSVVADCRAAFHQHVGVRDLHQEGGGCLGE